MLVCVLFLILIGFSCNRYAKTTDPVLVAIDSFIKTKPDSALRILETIDPLIDLDNYNRSFYYIQLTEAKSTTAQSLLPSDSLIDWTISYLDDKKDKALKIRVYILKGRICTELEEKEEAILIYQKALDIIDNKEEESFYETLSKIYDDLAQLQRSIYVTRLSFKY